MGTTDLVILLQAIYKLEFLKNNFWNIITIQSGKPTGDPQFKIRDTYMHLPVPLAPKVCHWHEEKR